MVLPEGILLAGTLASFGCPCRFRAQEGEMPVTEPDLVVLNILFFDLTPRVSGKSATERSLKVAEFDDCDLGVRIPFEVACLGDQEFHHLLATGLIGLIACG